MLGIKLISSNNQLNCGRVKLSSKYIFYVYLLTYTHWERERKKRNISSRSFNEIHLSNENKIKWKEDLTTIYNVQIYARHTCVVCLLNLHFLYENLSSKMGFSEINRMNAIAVVSTATALPARQPAVAFQNYQNMHTIVLYIKHNSCAYITRYLCIVSINFYTWIKQRAKVRCRKGGQRERESENER